MVGYVLLFSPGERLGGVSFSTPFNILKIPGSFYVPALIGRLINHFKDTICKPGYVNVAFLFTF